MAFVFGVCGSSFCAAEGDEAAVVEEEQEEKVEELPADLQPASQEEIEKESEKPLAGPTLVKKVGRDVVRGINTRFHLGGIVLMGADGAAFNAGFAQGFLVGYDYKNNFGLRAHFLTSIQSSAGLVTDAVRAENLSMRAFIAKADLQYFFSLSPKSFIYPMGGGGVYWMSPKAEGTWQYSPLISAGFGHEFMPRLEGLSVGYELSGCYLHQLNAPIAFLVDVFMKYSF